MAFLDSMMGKVVDAVGKEAAVEMAKDKAGELVESVLEKVSSGNGEQKAEEQAKGGNDDGKKEGGGIGASLSGL